MKAHKICAGVGLILHDWSMVGIGRYHLNITRTFAVFFRNKSRFICLVVVLVVYGEVGCLCCWSTCQIKGLIEK